LDHPNIVKILEVFSDSQHYYIVTECLEGGELLDRIKSITHYNEEVAKKYMKEILSAMVYCHARKIVHRDLKVFLIFNN
jgi:calcium-dependent protein kinase